MIPLRRPRTIAVLLSATAALALAGCGDRDNAAETAAITPPADPGAPAYDPAAPGAAGSAPTTPGTAPPMVAPEAPTLGAAAPNMGPGGEAANFTDEQLRQFAEASRQIHRDAADQPTQAQATAAADPSGAVRQAGLTPEEFMRIAAAALHDPALRQRITQQQQGSGGANPAGG